MTTTGTFLLASEADTERVIGKSWWNKSHVLTMIGSQRRALLGVGIGGAAVVGVMGIPIISAVGGALSGPDTRQEPRPALALQQQYGWSFGVANEAKSLSFPGGVQDPSLAAKIPLLSNDLAPKNPALVPFAVTTLFDSLKARPTETANTEDERAQGFVALQDVIQPITTAPMIAAGAIGTIIGGCTSGADVAFIIDLPGPAAVACAATMALQFDPVFLFDNWPHPRGVVPAHLTLAAALSQQPLFAAAKASRPLHAPPMFVLDRERLNPYYDEESQFDNRSLARLPSLEALQRLNIRQVIYVTPSSSPTIEADDVNDDLVSYAAGGLSVRAIDIEVLKNAAIGTNMKVCPADLVTMAGLGGWRPAPRQNQFSMHTRPTNFGVVPVVMNASTGMMMGALLYRGSWSRSSSSWSFGGG
jgi:hypothetical protein